MHEVIAVEGWELSEVVRQIRRLSGLSQREFAQRVGTSGPTISLYESGRKEPRWSTVVRMADLFGLDARSAIDTRDRGAALRERRDRRRRGLAAAVAAAVGDDWPRAEALGRRNLDVLRGAAHVSAGHWLDAWDALLDRGPEACADQLLAVGDEADDMRQMHPFAGMLSPGERRAALAAATLP
jgi:transcriptional regulator with XRE-family HTH domain